MLLPIALPGQNKSLPTIPQSFPPPEPDRPHLQIDQPPTVVHGGRRVRIDPAKTQQEASELAKLAQSIPADIDKVSKGQLPHDLGARLKRIEKLSKQLRRELAP